MSYAKVICVIIRFQVWMRKNVFFLGKLLFDYNFFDLVIIPVGRYMLPSGLSAFFNVLPDNQAYCAGNPGGMPVRHPERIISGLL